MSRKITQDKAKMLEQLKKTPIVQIACERVGVPRSTYYRWRKGDAEFASDCDTAIAESSGLINDMAESQLITAIKDGNMTAIIYWLKHHHNTYATRIELSGTLKHETEPLTAEQQAVVMQALELAGMNTNTKSSQRKEQKNANHTQQSI